MAALPTLTQEGLQAIVAAVYADIVAAVLCIRIVAATDQTQYEHCEAAVATHNPCNLSQNCQHNVILSAPWQQ